MQKTIGRPARCTGISITGCTRASVTFHPAPTGTGVVFIRGDLPRRPQIKCCPEYARSDQRWTSLDKNGVRIEHTEHVLAAVAGLDIDNIFLHLENQHVPVVSSFSSGDFVRVLLESGLVRQERPKKYIAVGSPQWVLDSFIFNNKRYDSLLLALPAPKLILTYLLDYPGKQIGTLLAHIVLGSPGRFSAELGPARSYIMDYEFDEVARLIGAGMKDCLVISSQGFPKLQWEDEPARHKLLDLLGDLATLGAPLRGHFIGIRTGHKANIRLCRKLLRQV